jgi:alkaline phosphatase
MHYESDRHNDKLGEPSLTEMTASTMELLAKNQQGYFLMVESGRIDHGHHAGNAYNALHDTIELADAGDYAVNHTNPDETLIIVTADHSHVFTLAGYPKRGNPILGKVISVGSDQPKLAADGLPYTTIGYMNGRGFHDFHDETDADTVYDSEITEGRADLSLIDTQRPGFHQEAHVPLESETHSAEDVSIYAKGVAAELVSGVNEQNMIFHIMNEVLY